MTKSKIKFRESFNLQTVGEKLESWIFRSFTKQVLKIVNTWQVLLLHCQLFQGLIVAEAAAEAVKAAEKQAADLKAFMDLSTELAEDEGKAQGQKAGRAVGTDFINLLRS